MYIKKTCESYSMNQEPWILASLPLPSSEDKWGVPALLILYSKTLPFPLLFPSLACSYYCCWCRASIDPTKSGRPIYGKREKIKKSNNHKVGVEPLLSFARYPRLSRLKWVSGWVSKWTLSHMEVHVRSREGRESGEKGLPLLSPPSHARYLSCPPSGHSTVLYVR